MDHNGLFDDYIQKMPSDAAPHETERSAEPGLDSVLSRSSEDAVRILDLPTGSPAEETPRQTYEPRHSRPSSSFYRETVRNESHARQDARFRRVASLVLVSCLLGGAALGFGYGAGSKLAAEYWVPRMSDDGESLKQFTINAGYLNTTDSTAYEFSYAAILGKVEPAVVKISTIKGVSIGSEYYTLRPGVDVKGAGSGMLFHETTNKYYIATNAHVLASSTAIYVSIENSGYISAALVGMEETADVAVISVDKTDAYNAGVTSVSLVTFGNSDALRVGDMVLTIGNALGEGNSATNGIISAKDRVIKIEGVEFTVIQTNAAINEGNSGGPLINMNGEVVGMNTAKLRESNVEGMGYSIPSNTVTPILEQIMRGGRAILGISGSDVTDAYRLIYEADIAGALVREIIPDSGAEAAGLMIDDVIVGINGNAIRNFDELKNALLALSPGDTVMLEVFRYGADYLEISAVLGLAE